MSDFPQRRNRDDVLNELQQLRRSDRSTTDGRTFGHVFTLNEEVQRLGSQAYLSFLTENGLAFHLFPSLIELEKKVVGWMLSHLRAPQGAAGTFTSGGTESIFLAVKACRDAARARGQAQRVEVLLPTTAHAAFHKAAQILGLQVRSVSVDPQTTSARVDSFAAQLSDRTLLLVTSAPSYSHGAMDPISAVGELAQSRGLFLHVDGCMGGFMLPFLEQAGAKVPPFDFRVPGVTSISADLHKYAFVPKGASVVLFREKSLRFHQLFATAEWTGYPLVNQTMLSSRSGGALAAAYAVLQFVGAEGYRAAFAELMACTRELVEGIKAIEGLVVRVDPLMPIFAFETRNGVSVFALADALRRRGWFVQPQMSFDGVPPAIHLTVLPNQVGKVQAFLGDLRQAMEELRSAPGVSLPEWMGALTQLGPEDWKSPELQEQLPAMIQAVLAEPSEDSAGLNELLERLPRPAVSLLLTHYLNELLGSPSVDR